MAAHNLRLGQFDKRAKSRPGDDAAIETLPLFVARKPISLARGGLWKPRER